MQNYYILKTLGSGAAGDVFLARHRPTNEKVALKMIIPTVERPQISEQTLKEVNLMKSLSHPNVVGYRDSFKDSGKLYIAMEYVDGGDLSAMISERRGRLLSEDDILKIFIQLMVALKYVHFRKVIHRDLKPQNIFLARVGVIKLGDFGISRALESSIDLARTRCGTPYYLSPEIWGGQAYNSQTDIWSAGCVLYELCTLQKPFQGQNVNQLLVAILQSKYQPLTSRYTDDLRSLVARMLSQEPTDRPTAADILQLPFVTARLVV
jgi:NIMA (never in mitosis gene a)-related kinase